VEADRRKGRRVSGRNAHLEELEDEVVDQLAGERDVVPMRELRVLLLEGPAELDRRRVEKPPLPGIRILREPLSIQPGPVQEQRRLPPAEFVDRDARGPSR
jgi:hypothetical protein